MAFDEALAGWRDSDGAAYELGRSLGLFREGGFAEAKWVFWTRNPLGDALHEALLGFTEAGVLDYDEDEDRFRWRGDPARRGMMPLEELRALGASVLRGQGAGGLVPAGFDVVAAQRRFDGLGERLSAAFGVVLPRVLGPEPGAALFGVHRVPAEATVTRERRTRARIGVSVLVSNFGDLATYHATGGGTAPPVHPGDGERVEAALSEGGCRWVPVELLRTSYDGESITWYDRLFGRG